MSEEKLIIVTQFVNPPIPIRNRDWCAYYWGWEESRRYGWGKTKEEAIQDLKDNYGED
jgi:hypothetical protein